MLFWSRRASEFDWIYNSPVKIKWAERRKRLRMLKAEKARRR
jgi:hypothetical protein